MNFRSKRPPHKLRKLLVIDDDAATLANYRNIFTPHNFLVLTAQDGEDAIPIVEQNPDIQLVILDLAMPRMDGRSWLRWLRGKNQELPVIVITGYKLDPEDVDLKPSVVLEKPAQLAELLDLVGLFCGLGVPVHST